MKRFGKAALAFGMVALMAAPALAQGRGFGGGGMMGGGMLLTNKSVHEELKATEDQVSKLQAFAEDFRAKQREAFRGFQDMPQEERQAKVREMQESLGKGVAEILKPEQVKRFRQIELQMASAQALNMPRVANALKLTDEQKEKVRDIVQEGGEQMRAIFQGAQDDREGAMKKMAELRKSTHEKAVKLLTDEQKKSYDELLGKPFEVKFEPRPN